MIISQTYLRIPQEELVISPGESAARLMAEREYTSPLISECEKELRSHVSCAFCAIRVKAEYPAEAEIDLGFVSCKSHDLYRNLLGSREAFVFAVTLGIEVDRLILKLSRLSPARHFITDALASAMAEAACDRTDNILSSRLICRPRFSPGYGDLSLELQPALCAALDAGRRLGLSVTDSLLLNPSKSVTAVIGLAHQPQMARVRGCAYCTLRETCALRKGGNHCVL